MQAIATVSACHIKGVVPDLPVARGFAHWPIGFSKKPLSPVCWPYSRFAGLVHVCLRCEASKHEQGQHTRGTASKKKNSGARPDLLEAFAAQVPHTLRG